jgi:hypothetical protein
MKRHLFILWQQRERDGGDVRFESGKERGMRICV